MIPPCEGHTHQYTLPRIQDSRSSRWWRFKSWSYQSWHCVVMW